MQAQPNDDRAEARRLAELQALDILDTASDTRLDQIVDLARDFFDVPIVLVSLLDANRQWFKARCGVDLTETSRDVSFCTHAVEASRMLVIPDARRDPRFADNPLVTGPPYIRFYAGAPIFGPTGQALGTLCVLDYVARSFTRVEQRRLQRLARLVQTELIGREQAADARANADSGGLEDSATGLPRRRVLRRRLDAWLAADPPSPLTLIGIQLTALPELRAGLGTDRADRLLRMLTDRIRAAVPGQAFFGCWDDHEFGLLAPAEVPGCSGDELAETVARSIDGPLDLDGEQYRLAPIIGVVGAPGDGTEATALLNAMRLAWRSAARRPVGDGVPVAHARGSGDIRHDLALGNRLDRAIENEAISIALQPRISLASGHIAGFEVLARWQDENGEWIPPAEFIPLAERLGSISALGGSVLRQAVRLAAQWRREGLAMVPLAVNLSAGELHQPDLPERIREIVAAEELPAGTLEFEVTESSFVQDLDAAVQTLKTLRGIGARFAIDDFGTGFSSFRYLRELPLDMLKIDRSFIDAIPREHNDAAIVQGIIAMARELNLEVVAEGIETAEQLLFMRAYRCDTVQGFLFSRPVTAEQAGAMLAEGRVFDTLPSVVTDV